MAQWKPKGQDDVIARLTRLEKKIEEQGRMALQRDRIKVNLALTNFLPAGYSKVVTSWDSFAEVDTANMYRRDVGGNTFLEIPYAGRWRIVLKSVFAGPRDTYGSLIALNDSVIGYSQSSSLALDSNAISSMGVNDSVATAERLLSTGDQVFFTFYVRTADTELRGHDILPNNPTYFMAEYIGPN